MNKTSLQKFATVTALAAACALASATPALAAPNSATTASVPSAMDSSQRVVRRSSSSAVAATPATVTNAAQPNVTNSVAATSATATSQVQPISATSAVRGYQSPATTSSGFDISRGQLAGMPVPVVQVSNVSFIPTVIVPLKQGSNAEKLDVSLLDDFIEDVSPNARHYPPNFPNRSQRYYARENIKALTNWLDPYASAPDASYEVLIRAAKLNAMGRNLDLGSDYAIRGGQYVDRAIKAQPNSGEANFLYGMMLSEGGGFKEGQKYLDRAVGLGYIEAEQSLAQSDLLSDKRSEALDRLRRLEQKAPNNAMIRQQIKLVEDGKYYIWDIPDANVNIKATPFNPAM